MKRTDVYAGPWPRKRHSHRCEGCARRGQLNAVACYKARCARPQLTAQCALCRAASATSAPKEGL
jgi:hypothetical protein